MKSSICRVCDRVWHAFSSFDQTATYHLLGEHSPFSQPSQLASHNKSTGNKFQTILLLTLTHNETLRLV